MEVNGGRNHGTEEYAIVEKRYLSWLNFLLLVPLTLTGLRSKLLKGRLTSISFDTGLESAMSSCGAGGGPLTAVRRDVERRAGVDAPEQAYVDGAPDGGDEGIGTKRRNSGEGRCFCFEKGMGNVQQKILNKLVVSSRSSRLLCF